MKQFHEDTGIESGT